ncbi:pyruvate kinase [candidate division WWE3 bacterium]|nr:pyruvate kinase [candidate division WWE3 bacterium]
MKLQKLSKIVATIGPSSDSPDKIENLIKAGVNVFRFNMKHNVTDWHLERIDRVQEIADKLKIPIGIMIDLQGPEIRIKTSNGIGIPLEKNAEIPLTSNANYASQETHEDPYIYLPQQAVIEALEPEDKFSIADGFYNFKVTKKLTPQTIKAQILNKGIIQNNKSLNLVGKDLALPSLIDTDLDKLDAAAKTKADFVALSFVRSAKDLETLRAELKDRKINAQMVAKVESQKGLDNIDEVIAASDAIMIARGDLGIETPLEQLPYYQKQIINKCREASKPVIVATQMLQSMVENPLPTRAEAADVAGAIYDGTDAIMLSEESAVGAHPVEAVRFMTSIAAHNEKHTTAAEDYIPDSLDRTHAVVRAALTMLVPFSGVHIDKLLVGTQTGYTARVFSSYRPKVPILALSDQQKTVETLTMTYGVVPVYLNFKEKDFTDPDVLMARLKADGFLEEGETILLVHGKRIKDPGNTNSLSVFTVA